MFISILFLYLIDVSGLVVVVDMFVIRAKTSHFTDIIFFLLIINNNFKKLSQQYTAKCIGTNNFDNLIVIMKTIFVTHLIL
jgi:hypothetical protein